MKRIGFLGGTFNPIHIGHLAIAHMAMENACWIKSFLSPRIGPRTKQPMV